MPGHRIAGGAEELDRDRRGGRPGIPGSFDPEPAFAILEDELAVDQFGQGRRDAAERPVFGAGEYPGQPGLELAERQRVEQQVQPLGRVREVAEDRFAQIRAVGRGLAGRR
ncbi:hypothetical protein GCM10029992_56040 [Glycomyces albus]